MAALCEESSEVSELLQFYNNASNFTAVEALYALAEKYNIRKITSVDQKTFITNEINKLERIFCYYSEKLNTMVQSTMVQSTMGREKMDTIDYCVRNLSNINTLLQDLYSFLQNEPFNEVNTVEPYSLSSGGNSVSSWSTGNSQYSRNSMDLETESVNEKPLIQQYVTELDLSLAKQRKTINKLKASLSNPPMSLFTWKHIHKLNKIIKFYSTFTDTLKFYYFAEIKFNHPCEAIHFYSHVITSTDLDLRNHYIYESHAKRVRDKSLVELLGSSVNTNNVQSYGKRLETLYLNYTYSYESHEEIEKLAYLGFYFTNNNFKCFDCGKKVILKIFPITANNVLAQHSENYKRCSVIKNNII